MKKFAVAALAALVMIGCGNSPKTEANDEMLITSEGLPNLKFTDAKPEFDAPYEVIEEYEEMDDYTYYAVKKDGELLFTYEPRAMITVYSPEYVTEEGIRAGDPLNDALAALREAGHDPILGFDNGYHNFVVNYGQSKVGLVIDNSALVGGYDRFNEWWGKSGDPDLLSFDDFADDAKINSIIVVNW